MSLAFLASTMGHPGHRKEFTAPPFQSSCHSFIGAEASEQKWFSLKFLLGDIYYVYVFYMRPGDVGFELLSRLRVFFMCLLKGLVGLLQMCCFAYDQMC
jgi:hypothetical protein